ncbi:hypothetical protein EVAR_75501_1 [Eumeta japonica]|uniref:Uncharacterized protein n=1 Tax=Eumeta variegata TaxID=151549 RepID=A0A4C1TK33_EUMVA|nr:hypothetical protein EVAR_75501_1 [Eumeta japonica]
MKIECGIKIKKLRVRPESKKRSSTEIRIKRERNQNWNLRKSRPGSESKVRSRPESRVRQIGIENRDIVSSKKKEQMLTSQRALRGEQKGDPFYCYVNAFGAGSSNRAKRLVIC